MRLLRKYIYVKERKVLSYFKYFRLVTNKELEVCMCYQGSYRGKKCINEKGVISCV